MDTRYGKLVLRNSEGPEREFELAKPSISIGRATTNDIILDDLRVSRGHARLDCSVHGVILEDRGSANGTVVNGVVIKRATLVPGDEIALGGHQFSYQIDDPSEDIGMTVIDTQAQLDQTLKEEFLPMVLNDTINPSLTVFTGAQTWRFDLSDSDSAMIGRDENSPVFIDADNVSRRHAEVQRRGNVYLLRDLGSTNGTWIDDQRIDQHVLRDGEVFRVGPTRIMFKKGVQESAHTLASPAPIPAGRRTVVFVPGLMGSELWLGNERVWPNVKTLFTNPELFLYPSVTPLKPRRIVDEVVIVPNLIKQDQYNRLGDYLVEELNYRRGVDFFEFPYDWRQDVRISAGQLDQLIKRIPRTQTVVIIAHSLGTLVTRYYVEYLGGARRVERIILMGGPHKGVVKGLVSLLVAPEVLPFGIMGERLRKIIMTFPSSYQILPDYPAGTDQHGVRVNFLEEANWLPSDYLPLLQLGRDFRQELGTAATVPTVSIFGYGIKTISDVSVRRTDKGRVKEVNYLSENSGDGSVLAKSAFLQGSEIHPVYQHHGALFVDNDVKMRLKIELTRPY